MSSLYIGLAATAVVAVVAWVAGSCFGWGWMSDLAPNVLTEALSILVTVAVVQKLIDRRRTEDEGVRVKQALAQVSGNLHVLADFALWDYAGMHVPEGTAERPPTDLPGLLRHFSQGLSKRAGRLPEDPSFLVGTKSLAEQLDQQIQRHERVLDHDFIAAAYQFMRSERMNRNMYNRPESYRPGGTEKWRENALMFAVFAVVRFVDAFEAYASGYLDKDQWHVTLHEEAIDSFLRPPSETDDDSAEPDESQ